MANENITGLRPTAPATPVDVSTDTTPESPITVVVDSSASDKQQAAADEVDHLYGRARKAAQSVGLSESDLWPGQTRLDMQAPDFEAKRDDLAREVATLENMVSHHRSRFSGILGLSGLDARRRQL